MPIETTQERPEVFVTPASDTPELFPNNKPVATNSAAETRAFVAKRVNPEVDYETEKQNVTQYGTRQQDEAAALNNAKDVEQGILKLIEEGRTDDVISALATQEEYQSLGIRRGEGYYEYFKRVGINNEAGDLQVAPEVADTFNKVAEVVKKRQMTDKHNEFSSYLAASIEQGEANSANDPIEEDLQDIFSDSIVTLLPEKGRQMSQLAEKLGIELGDTSSFTRADTAKKVYDWLYEPDNKAELLTRFSAYQNALIQLEAESDKNDESLFGYLLPTDIGNTFNPEAITKTIANIHQSDITVGGVSVNLASVEDVAGVALTLAPAVSTGIKLAKPVTSVKDVVANELKITAPETFQNEVIEHALAKGTGEPTPTDGIFDDAYVQEGFMSGVRTDRVKSIAPNQTIDTLADADPDVIQIIEKGRGRYYRDSLLDENVSAKALKGIQKAMNTRLKAEPVDSFIYRLEGSPIDSIIMQYGTPDTKAPFKSMKAAQAYGENHLAFGQFTVVPAEKKGFYIQIQKTPDLDNAAGLIQLQRDVRLPLNLQEMLKPITSSLSRAGLTPASELYNAGRSGTNLLKSNALIAEVFKPLVSNFNKVNGKGKKFLEKSFAASQEQGRFMTKMELRGLAKREGFDYTDDIGKAYDSVVAIENLNWANINGGAYAKRLQQGYKTIDFSKTEIADSFYGGMGNGRVVPLSSVVDRTVVDLSNRKLYSTGSVNQRLSMEELTKLEQGGYVAIKLEEPVKVYGGSSKFAIVKKNDVGIHDLAPIQVGFRHDARRIYEARFKVGQARVLDGYLERPKTFTMALTRAEAEKSARILEEARLIYKRGLAEGDALKYADDFDNLGIGDPSINTLAKFSKLVDEGSIDANSVIEFAKTGEDLPSVTRLKQDVNTKITEDVNTLDTADMLTDIGYGYWSKRGQHLLDLEGNQLKTFDLSASINKSIHGILKSQLRDPYYDRSMRQWVNRFLSPEQKKRLAGATLREKFNAPVDHLKGSARNEAIAVRNGIERMIGSGEPSIYNEWVLSTVDWMSKNKWLDKNVNPKLISLSSKDPEGFLTSVAFNMYLGLGNTAQFLTQASTGAILLTGKLVTNPSQAAKVLDNAFTLSFIHLNPNPETRLKVIQKLTKISGDDEEIATNLYEAWTNLYARDITHSTAVLNGTDEHVAAGAIRRGADTITQYGAAAFSMGERWNRAVAMSLASTRMIDELGVGGYKQLLKSRQGIDTLVDKANALNQNMLSARETWLQSGAGAKSLFQFGGFFLNTARTLVGGNRAIRGKDLAGFYAGLFALSGANASSATEEIYNATLEYTGLGKSIPAGVDKMLRYGVPDMLLYMASQGELNTAFGARTAPIRGAENFISNMFGVFTGTETEGTLPAASAVTGLGRAVYNLGALASESNMDTEVVTQAAKEILTENISILGAFDKAVLGYHVGYVYSKSGYAMTPVTKAESMALILGIPAEGADMSQKSFQDITSLFGKKSAGELKKTTSNVARYYRLSTIFDLKADLSGEAADRQKAQLYWNMGKLMLDSYEHVKFKDGSNAKEVILEELTRDQSIQDVTQTFLEVTGENMVEDGTDLLSEPDWNRFVERSNRIKQDIQTRLENNRK